MKKPDRWESLQPHAKAGRVFQALSLVMVVLGLFAAGVPIGTVIAIYLGMQLWKWELPEANVEDVVEIR